MHKLDYLYSYLKTLVLPHNLTLRHSFDARDFYAAGNVYALRLGFQKEVASHYCCVFS